MLTRFRTHMAYAIGGVANSFALFLLIPYLVLRLTPAEYGFWNLFEISILFVTMLAGAGLDTGLIRSYWGEDADPPRPLVGTVLIGAVAWGLVIALVGGIACWVLSQFLVVRHLLPPAVPPLSLVLVVITGVVEGWFNLLMAVLRVREQANAYAAASFGRMLLFVLLAVAWVEGGAGIAGALSARLTAAVAGVILTGSMLLPHIEWVWKPTIWKRVVRYGLPLLPTNVSNYALFSADRYVLAAFTSTQVVGVYSFMFKLATTLDLLLIRPFYLDWAQRRFMVAARPDAKQAYGKVALFVFWATAALGLLIFAGSRAIYVWLANPVYEPGLPLIPLILLGFVAYALSYPLNVGMILKDRTGWLPWLSGSAALTNVALNLWWIPLFGMAGAALANVSSLSLYTLLIALASQRLYPIDYPWGEGVKVVLAAAAAAAGIYLVDSWMLGAQLGATLIKVLWVAVPMATVGYHLFGSYLRRRPPALTLEKVEG